jgi:hypothetical protein
MVPRFRSCLGRIRPGVNIIDTRRVKSGPASDPQVAILGRDLNGLLDRDSSEVPPRRVGQDPQSVCVLYRDDLESATSCLRRVPRKVGSAGEVVRLFGNNLLSTLS